MKKLLIFLGAFFPAIAFCGDILPVYTCQDLQNIQNNLEGRYQVMNDIDCIDTPWVPIKGSFSGELFGKNGDSVFAIKNVSIKNQPTPSGMFEK
jgi:hypothetical protein